jgi:Mg2+ and Co2+ transporter CorA
MISKYSHKGLTWVDLESGSKEELEHAVELLSIPSYIQEKLQINNDVDVVHMDDDFMLVNIGNDVIFVVSNSYVLSIHKYPILALDKFGKELELDIVVEEKSKIKNHKLLFAHLLKNLYTESELQIVMGKIENENLKQQIVEKTKKLKLFTILSIIFLVTTIIFICL